MPSAEGASFHEVSLSVSDRSSVPGTERSVAGDMPERAHADGARQRSVPAFGLADERAEGVAATLAEAGAVVEEPFEAWTTLPLASFGVIQAVVWARTPTSRL